jgi:hypothetical protein
MEDNLLPNDGSTYFLAREPQEQIIARKKEQAQILEALKVIDTVISHFDERIASLDSLESIAGVSIETKPADFQKAFLLNREIKQALIEEKGLLQDLVDTHKR